MSSAGQGSKTKQELLEEYEKDYLARLENADSKSVDDYVDLQNTMFQVTQEIKQHEVNDYVANCASCKKPVEKEDLKYANGREFHAECFETHGNEFEPINYDLLNKTSRMKVELTLLKNLQSRSEGSNKKSTSSGTKRKTTKKKRTSRKKKRTKSKRKVKRRTKTKKRTSRRKPKRKASRRKTKRRTTKKKTKRRTATKKSTARRKPKRKASRRKTKKSLRRRKTRRRR